MPLADTHRKVEANQFEIISLQPPFSFFDFVEERFGSQNSIHRICSLARSFQAQSLIIEDINPTGIIAEENEDIEKYYPMYQGSKLHRISFWMTTHISENSLTSSDLVGYAILKLDILPTDSRWHVFESVFPKTSFISCSPRPQKYDLKIIDQSLQIQGILYCQQNALNKACAQVALRTILSRILPGKDISYRKLNEIAKSVNPAFSPGSGLGVKQIRRILDIYNVQYFDVDYDCSDPSTRNDLPYQKYVYSGLEAGSGALIGFRLSGKEVRKHIIPIYGHTFSKDTWAPNADASYFHIDESLGYVPSESWTNSFIGHDDNFGSNFCIPRLYIEKGMVDYVIEIFQPGVKYPGVDAEAMALNILYSLIPRLDPDLNKWNHRLIETTLNQQIVLRAQTLYAEEYMDHLRSLKDWDQNEENPQVCDELMDSIPSIVWAVEVSVPQLFPANERKLGEIIFDATRKSDGKTPQDRYDLFTLARLPGVYFFGGLMTDDEPEFTPIQSQLESHTGLIKL